MRQNLAEAFQGELQPGERLLWKGRPRQGLMLRRYDAFMIPFSLIWTFGVLQGLRPLVVGGTAALDPVSATASVLLALYLIAGRFFLDAWLRDRTWYAVTDMRAMIRGGWSTRSVKTVAIQADTRFSLTEHRDGSGTIVLGEAEPPSLWTFKSDPLAPRPRDPNVRRSQLIPLADLDEIDGVRPVYDLLVRLQAIAARDAERGLCTTIK